MTKIVLAGLIVGLLVAGTVSADRLADATPEIQGFATTTSISALGTVTETDSVAWTLRTNIYNETFPDYVPEPDAPFGYGPGALSDPLKGDQSIDTTGYNDNTVAISGQTTYVKTMAISTANKLADGSNLKATTDLQFIAADTGRATRSEDILIDGAGNVTEPTSLYFLCPFAAEKAFFFPSFCNIAQAGSSIDTTLASVRTSADDRFIARDSTIPVVLNYNIAAKGITLSDGTSSPMIGSVSAFIKVHIQESIDPELAPAESEEDALNAWRTKSEDLTYSETTSASGLVNSFTKSMQYQSGFNLI